MNLFSSLHPASRRARRAIATASAAAFTWLALAPTAHAALGAGKPRGRGHVRELSPAQMRAIKGSISMGIPEAVTGSAYPWEGTINEINSINGNKITALPIVNWTARGGLPVDFTLYHNSGAVNTTSELGPRWTYSLDLYVIESTGEFGEQLVTMHWGDDLSYTFLKNANGTYSAPAGITDTLVKDATGYTLTTKGQVRYRFETAYSGQRPCIWIKDRSDNQISLSYNGSGSITSLSDGTGRSLAFTYNGSGKLTTLVDPMSRTFSFSYDGSGRLQTVTFPAVGGSSPTVTYGYDSSNRITSITDPRSKVWTFSYNSDHSLAWEKNPLNQQTSYSYTSTYTQATDPRGNTIKHNYASGARTSTVVAGSFTESYTYNSNGDRLTTTLPLGGVWTFTYDAKGNVLTRKNPLNKTWTYTYNASNDVLTETTPLGYVTSYGYDGSGRLTSVTDPLSHADTFTVNSYGLVTQKSDALGHNTTFGFDSYGNPVTITNALSQVTTLAYDTLGRVTSVTDGTGKVTSTAYDNLGRVSSVTLPGSRTTSFAYDLAGNKTSQTNPLGQVDSFTYDDAGRLATHTDPLSRVVSYGYDSAGNKTSFTDGRSKVTSYSYNSRDLLSGITYPDSTTESYTYNNNGQLSTRVDGRGVTRTHTYDSAGRLTGLSYSDSTPSVTFGFDNDDRKTSLVDGSGTTSYTFDNASRLTGRTAPQGAVTFGYDNADRLTSRTVAGTSVTSFSYDNADRLTGVSAPGSESTSYSYDAAGRKTGTTFANASTETLSYDATSTLLSQVWHKTSGGSTLSKHTYAYNSAARRTSETLADGAVISYGYDAGGQLTSESRTGSSAYSISYTYDNAGNRLTKVLGGVTESYSYDNANKLTGAGSKTYSYDSAGNCTGVTVGGSTTSLTWDGESRLKSVTVGGSTTNYSYNGLGQRVTKSGGVSRSYILAGDSIDAPVLADGQASYIHAGGLISESRSGSSKFYHADSLGTTRALSNSSQSVTDSLDTDGFGLTVVSSGSTPSPFGFAGQHGYQVDSESGLLRLGHRMYDSATGRFLARDPIRDGYNWYAYCDNDPVNAVDPEGLYGDDEKIQPPKHWKKVPSPKNPPHAKILPPTNENRLSKDIDNHIKEIIKRIGELREDKQGLDERKPGDEEFRSRSRWGHRDMIEEHRRRALEKLRELEKLMRRKIPIIIPNIPKPLPGLPWIYVDIDPMDLWGVPKVKA